MDSSPIAPQSASTSGAPPPLAEVEAKSEERVKEMVHRTKVIQFLGRKAPIILQNDNGPCPLLAICNVLSLKNSLNLSPDISEVSQEKLLSLVAERLIDSNTDINNKNTGYVENQQQNIADAIDLLPRLRTGIDVNVKFRRIDDFEFTPECAIFDLLDIPLYHGWIVDPQDNETADAIGSKSYNTLMGELVSLETKNMESERKINLEDDSVDFVAATTSALGVPSPSLSTGHSCDESPQKARKGDIEEEAELLRVLKLSEGKVVSLAVGAVAGVNIHENAHIKKSELVTELRTLEKRVTDETVKTESIITTDRNTLNNCHLNLKSSEVFPQIAVDLENRCAQTIREESSKYGDSIVGSDAWTESGKIQPLSVKQDPLASGNSQDEQRSDENTPNESTTPDANEQMNDQNACVHRDTPSSLNAAADAHATSGQMHHLHEHEAFSSSVDSSEPIYEGEECILDSGSVAYKNREPVYEGEVVLGEQVDMGSMDNSDLSSKAMSVKQGEIIRNFMKNSASQLTVFGLFCLQDKVKEREICVFFRNNHFNTMFKYEGELYILATDQGFINQPDLVWEKLNEVNGDTVYMTSDFKVFKMEEDHSNSTWDEHNVLDYLASIDNTQENSSFNSDLQLAIALQQQEFDQQQQVQQVQQVQQPHMQQPHMQQPSTSGSSRLVTGPQASRSRGKHSTSSKHEPKSKDRCILM